MVPPRGEAVGLHFPEFLAGEGAGAAVRGGSLCLGWLADPPPTCSGSGPLGGRRTMDGLGIDQSKLPGVKEGKGAGGGREGRKEGRGTGAPPPAFSPSGTSSLQCDLHPRWAPWPPSWSRVGLPLSLSSLDGWGGSLDSPKSWSGRGDGDLPPRSGLSTPSDLPIHTGVPPWRSIAAPWRGWGCPGPLPAG